jgi:hypothetical protein
MSPFRARTFVATSVPAPRSATSTLAPPTERPRRIASSRKAGRTGCSNVTLRGSGSKPRPRYRLQQEQRRRRRPGLRRTGHRIEGRALAALAGEAAEQLRQAPDDVGARRSRWLVGYRLISLQPALWLRQRERHEGVATTAPRQGPLLRHVDRPSARAALDAVLLRCLLPRTTPCGCSCPARLQPGQLPALARLTGRGRPVGHGRPCARSWSRSAPRIVRHGRYVAFQLAEVAVPRSLFAEILERVNRLRGPLELGGELRGKDRRAASSRPECARTMGCGGSPALLGEIRRRNGLTEVQPRSSIVGAGQAYGQCPPKRITCR